MRYETRVLLLTLAAGLPAVAVAVALLAWREGASWLGMGLLTAVVGTWLAFAFAVRRRLTYSLHTVTNLLETLRRGDFSLRARRSHPGDALDGLFRETNELAEILRSERFGALEASALLRRVIGTIDVAVFAFDAGARLRLVNRAGERLLAQPARRLLGRDAAALGLAELLAGPPNQTVERPFPGGLGRWGVRRSVFREGGVPHRLLVVTDLSHALREEERKAWQRLIRVLGHELNNSLTPIKSMAATLRSLLGRQPPPADREEDLERGLAVIEDRAAALSRFMASYSRLAQLPPPRLEPVPFAQLASHVAAVETRLPVAVLPGPEVAVEVDRAQLEQLLINLVRNAVEAAGETGGGVRLGWRQDGRWLEAWVEDEGPGLPPTANLFVPFFTTKPGGSGIGLVLARQIAEAHGGTLALENRTDGAGTRALLRLPLGAGEGRQPQEPAG
ncbi:MAG TPA: ATP-binding protein [Thermoanaerobaculia bacterium]|nr:ATP-binding protein [Thermoanaerobaculia bacterium]